MSTPTSWLKQICSKDVGRPTLAEPMTVERAGKHYTFATDGHRAVELPGNFGEFRNPPKDMVPSILKILAPTPDAAQRISFTALKEFLREALKDVLWECPTCENEGFELVLHRGQACPEPCRTCDRRVIRKQKVYILDRLFEARLFKPFIDNLPDTDSVRWYQEFDRSQALIDGGAWRFIVMPMMDDGDNESVPRFEIGGEEARAA